MTEQVLVSTHASNRTSIVKTFNTLAQRKETMLFDQLMEYKGYLYVE